MTLQSDAFVPVKSASVRSAPTKRVPQRLTIAWATRLIVRSRRSNLSARLEIKTSDRLRTSAAAPDWIGEGEQITEKDLTFDELTLLPDTLKSVKVISRYTNELARQSVVGIDAVIRTRLVRDVADKIDDAFLLGDGTGNTVTGLVNQTGIQTGTLDTADVDSLHDAVALFFAAEVDPTSGRWFMAPDDFVAFRKLKATDGRYIVEPDVTQQGAYRLLSMPVTVTNKLTAGTTLPPARCQGAGPSAHPGGVPGADDGSRRVVPLRDVEEFSRWIALESPSVAAQRVARHFLAEIGDEAW